MTPRFGLWALVLLGPNAACVGSGGTDTDAEPVVTTTSTSGSSSSPAAAASSSGSLSSSSDDTGSSSSGADTTGSTSAPSPTSSPPDDDDGGGGPPPPPACSVEKVTQGGDADPLPRGEAGEFPEVIAEILENYCGCHTLADNHQNVEWEFLRAPGNTLFLAYDDLSRGYGGGTLAQAMASSLEGEMPPGSCPRPQAPLDLLAQWFADGMPNAADYGG